jgi:NAD(P)-dependent dehydrogenase (short-subunit alcohol dehydrogenase family)
MTVRDFTLKNKVAVVTGGSHGIGRAISLGFAEFGATVCIAVRNTGIGEEVATSIRNAGNKCMVVPVDVTKKDQVVGMVNKVIAEYGRIDILVNNAGGSTGVNFGPGRIKKISERDWDETFTANVTSIFLCTRTVAEVMLKQKEGCIINMASIVGQFPFPGFPAYSASKAAVISLTKSLATELAPHIRVNAIAPGLIETPRTSKNRGPEHLKHLLSNVLLARMGTPEDVAGAAIYLASDAASFITGTVIDVNGGQMSLTKQGEPYFRD